MPLTRGSDQRLRVMQLARDAGYGGIGGAEILVLEFARHLDPERFASYLCTTRRPEPDRSELSVREGAELRAHGVTVDGLDRRASWSIAPFARLYSILRRERIDILHAHMPRANIPGSILARLARVPVVITHEHGSILYGNRLRRLLDRAVVGRLSDAVLAVSEWDRRNMIERQGLPADRVRVFRNGILPLAAPDLDLRRVLSPAGLPLVGALGRLDPVKGYADLLAAVVALKRAGRSVRIVIAGVGADEARLRGLISELGLGAEVSLLGLREDISDLLHAFDVAVISSHSEGAPLALIEYMAAGLPIVATAVGGIPELIEDGVNGLLVPARDPAGLAAAVARLLDDPGLARRLGEAARIKQARELTLDAAVQRLGELYEELYARHRRRAGAG